LPLARSKEPAALTARFKSADANFAKDFHATLVRPQSTRGDWVEFRWSLGGDSRSFFHHIPANALSIRLDPESQSFRFPFSIEILDGLRQSFGTVSRRLRQRIINALGPLGFRKRGNQHPLKAFRTLYVEDAVALVEKLSRFAVPLRLRNLPPAAGTTTVILNSMGGG
jgi:hypothetical protein